VSFNVYLHHSRAFESYLARLQMLANDKPLLLAEFGLDSLREGEARQAELLAEQIDGAFRAGAAGAIVFSFTDDWVRCDQPVLDWAFGVTTRERVPKRAFAAVREAYRRVPPVFGAKPPKVSVVVACYNGASTLPLCLDSLLHLNYPDYEVILVDDGSTDATAQIAGRFPSVRLVQIPHQGLSAARNAGIAAATGAIVAFTDADCRADEDWLRYLVDDLLRSDFVGMGGPNFLPPDDSLVAAAVMVSPGGPAPVMLTDRVAEHLPGCNLAFYKWALEDIGGFDPMFKRAGDDVDICWRLQERGYRLGYSPAAFVWHYRRSTVGAYLKQQSGYGEAEALLARKHPEYFNALGASIWRGRIYAPAQTGVFLRRPVVYHGVFGSALFQRLYAPEPAAWSGLFTSLEYHGLVTAPLLVLAASFRPLLLVALASLLVSLGVCGLAGAQADLPKRKRRWWSRPLVALLFLLQPLARGWARYRWRLQARSAPVLLAVSTPAEAEPVEKLHYWSQSGLDRIQFLQALLATLDTQAWQHKVDAGWSDHDVEIFGSRWSRLRLTTVGEAFRPYQLILRCRLQAAWSFWARLVFAALLGAELLVIGFFSAAQPWLWMLLLSLVLFGWYLDQAKRVMQQAIATLLDSVAQQLGLVKLREDGESGQLKPVDAPPLPAPKSAAPPLVRVVTPQVQGDSQEPVSKR
jgi:GT2 family glycosyltransferase